MGSKNSDQSLPEVGKAPLIIDVEFLEEEDEDLDEDSKLHVRLFPI